jgi:hypothetical protein
MEASLFEGGSFILKGKTGKGSWPNGYSSGIFDKKI